MDSIRLFTFFPYYLCVIMVAVNLPNIACGDLCKNEKLNCYNCDSRYDTNCLDPFNSSLPANLLPPIRMCNGCCTKILYYPNGEGWVQRSCTENVINFSWLSRGCLRGVDGNIKMCVCSNKHLCNKSSFWYPSVSVIIGLGVILLVI